MKLLHYVFAVAILFPFKAFPWGGDGHQAIALAADDWLNEPAKTQVHNILAGQSIEDAATWPDDIRGGAHPGRLFGLQEERDFDAVEAHKGNDQWHFVNLPLGLVDYQHSTDFTTPTDIVQMIGKCIDVLEGHSTFMEKRDALRWMSHLVGDVHQPLHVGIGFFSFDASGQATLHRDPVEAVMNKESSDRGGNRLRKGSVKLHADWDTNIPALLGHDANTIADAIRGNLSHVTDTTTGQKATWAAQWATESAKVSNSNVYDDTVTFGLKDSDDQGWFIHTSWPTNYNSAHKNVALQQLTLAAKRLADLLNSIQWPH